MKSIRRGLILLVVTRAAFFIGGVAVFSALENSHVFAGEAASESTATQADRSHDFDFLIGDW